MTFDAVYNAWYFAAHAKMQENNVNARRVDTDCFEQTAGGENPAICTIGHCHMHFSHMSAHEKFCHDTQCCRWVTVKCCRWYLQSTHEVWAQLSYCNRLSTVGCRWHGGCSSGCSYVFCRSLRIVFLNIEYEVWQVPLVYYSLSKILTRLLLVLPQLQ